MADIGEKLRSAREAKGLSIEDIEKATKIQGRYLTAIEQDEFEKLPGDFYVRAFIRQYAQIVGLDGKELLSEYHKDIPQTEPDEYVEDSIDNKSEEVRKTTSTKRKLWKDYLPRIIIGLGIIAVLLICYVVYAHFSSNNNQANNSANDVSVSSERPKKRKKKKKIKRNSVKIKELATNQYQITGLKNNRNLVVRAGDQSTTVTIAINGVRQNAQTLTAGQKHTMLIPATTQSMVVTFSNATGTSVTIGGKKVPYNVQTAYLSLTFFIGKRRVNQPSQSTNNSGTSSGTTSNSGHNSHSSHTNNNHGQSQHQSNNTGNANNGTQQNNNKNNQSGQNNNQGSHENNQSNGNDNSSQTNHSDDSSNNNGDDKD